MNFDFAEKTVLITGASRGIGREIARMFAEAGARVVVHYNTNRDAAANTLATLAGEGHVLAQANMADTDTIAAMADRVIEQTGEVDILVNNAGIYVEHPFDETDTDEWAAVWARTIAVNLTGPAHLTYRIAQHMIPRGGGRIVNVSSRGAFRGEPTAPAYGASKAGLNAFGQSMAQALAPHGVFIGTVAPGFVETDMAEDILNGPRGDGIRNQSPLGRVATPAEVAQAVLFLAAPGTEFMTGCIIDVNGASYLRT